MDDLKCKIEQKILKIMYSKFFDPTVKSRKLLFFVLSIATNLIFIICLFDRLGTSAIMSIVLPPAVASAIWGIRVGFALVLVFYMIDIVIIKAITLAEWSMFIQRDGIVVLIMTTFVVLMIGSTFKMGKRLKQ
jgi:hypothetical protein